MGKTNQRSEGQKPGLVIDTAATNLDEPKVASPFDRRMSVMRDASPDQAAQGLALDKSAHMLTKVSLYSSISRNQRGTIYEDQDGEESKTHDDD